jgi:hypothetical protein
MRARPEMSPKSQARGHRPTFVQHEPVMQTFYWTCRRRDGRATQEHKVKIDAVCYACECARVNHCRQIGCVGKGPGDGRPGPASK